MSDFDETNKKEVTEQPAKFIGILQKSLLDESKRKAKEVADKEPK